MKNLPAIRFPKLKEFFQVLMKFDQIVQDDIETSDGDTRMRLSRVRDDRFDIKVYRIGKDFDFPVLSIVMFYSNCDDYKSISELHAVKGNPRFFTYSKNSEGSVQFKNQLSVHESESTILNYPLQEEQFFQKLTQYPLPPEEEFQYLMDSAIEWFKDDDKFNGFWITVDDQLDVEDETKFESMVQYMVHMLYKLYAENDHKLKQ